MNIETLKQLIETESQKVNSVSDFKFEVFRLLDLYERDKSFVIAPGFPKPGFIVQNEPDEVMYSKICPCNPNNGGNGICGCIMGNKMVPNPKKYTYICGTTITDLQNLNTLNSDY